MGTSRSGDPEGWAAGASVFSGRPDPRWSVSPELGVRLAELWESLPPWTGERPAPPLLGYRGCRLEAPGGRVWTAFGQLVEMEGEARRDAGRDFERALITSAPPGTLPAF